MAQLKESDQVMDTRKPFADTIVSPEPIVDEEVSQGKEGEANIHEPTADTAVIQEPAVEKEAYPRKNNIQKCVDNIVVMKEPAAEVEQFHP